jgi:hypothetical protein
MQEHKFLSFHPYCLSNGKAEHAVDDLLKRVGFSLLEITSMKRGTRLLWEHGNTHIWLRYKKLITEMRVNGIVEQLDSYLDSLDPIFGGRLALATTSSAITLSVSYADYSQTLQGPARLYQAEYELADDILFYRQQACDHSWEPDFIMTARFCRAYMAACVSIVDAFINRHIWIANHAGLATPDFSVLKASTNTEERIELWIKVFTGKTATEINGGTEWKHFQDLREERNKLIHVKKPYSLDFYELLC